MKELYTQEGLSLLNRKIKLCKILFIFVAIMFVAIEILLIVFASYDAKTYYMIAVAAVGVVSPILFIYFFDKRKYLIVIKSEFMTILESEKEEKTIKIISSPKRTITLSDSTCVYEIVYEEGGDKHLIYLSNIFENIFQVDKEYRVIVSCGYIVGHEDER